MTKRSRGEPCLVLPWDSEFFGFPIGRIKGNLLTEDLAAAIDNWCLSRGIVCNYFLARADDPTTTRLAEKNGYRFVDIRLTFTRSTIEDIGRQLGPERPGTVVVREFQENDKQTLRRIAASGYQDSRFFYDSRFPKRLSRALYEVWIMSSCEGYAEAVLVAELDERAVGYVTCHLGDNQTKGSIGLVGVGADARGRGVGQQLVNSAITWFRDHGAGELEVVTQGRNVAAQRLYQRGGFLTADVQLWYHKWYSRVGLSDE